MKRAIRRLRNHCGSTSWFGGRDCTPLRFSACLGRAHNVAQARLLNRSGSRTPIFVGILVFFTLSLFPAFTLWAGTSAKPNVLIILADDMGFSDAGCYGGEINTPNLDGLARDGLRFTQFYNTARCWPSRAAIMTGYYAQAVRRDTVPGIASGTAGERPIWAPLLSERLKLLGYRCYHSGKWHLDGKPMENGFDHDYTLYDQDRHFAPRTHTEDDKPLPAVIPGSGYYSTTAIADHAIKYLKEHADTHSNQPFFEYLAFTCPHFPLQAPPEDIAKYRDRYARGWDELRGERWDRMHAMGIGGSNLSETERHLGPPYAFPQAIRKLGPDEVNLPLEWDTMAPAQQAFASRKMPIHAAMVDRMDQEIGRVLDQLRAMGAMDNTLIFFLSDNGASAEMMVRGDGHDPSAEFGSAKTFLSIGPGWSTMCNTPFRRHKTWVHEGGISRPSSSTGPRGLRPKGSCATRRDTSLTSCPQSWTSPAARLQTPGTTSPPRPCPAGASFHSYPGTAP